MAEERITQLASNLPKAPTSINTVNVDAVNISVIIPTFNRNWSLLACLNSVLNQSLRQFECIIIDDGSTDTTESLVQGFIESLPEDSPLFRYIKTDNHGVSAARNTGVNSCNPDTKYIAFLDSDDLWHPDKLKLQLELHQTEPHLKISQTQEIWIREGVRVNAPKHYHKIHGEQFEANLKNCMITPSSVFLTKDLWEEFGGFDEEFPACEDYDLWVRISSKYPIGLIPRNLITRNGGHSDQLSTKVTVLDVYRMKALVKLLKSQTLSEVQIQQTIKILRKKHQIVSKGALKRENFQIIHKIAPIRDFIDGLAY